MTRTLPIFSIPEGTVILDGQGALLEPALNVMGVSLLKIRGEVNVSDAPVNSPSAVTSPPWVILKIVPKPLAPPPVVVPYKLPALPYTSPALGLIRPDQIGRKRSGLGKRFSYSTTTAQSTEANIAGCMGQ